MIPDAEIISLLCTIFTKLDVGEFTVKVNFVCDSFNASLTNYHLRSSSITEKSSMVSSKSVECLRIKSVPSLRLLTSSTRLVRSVVEQKTLININLAPVGRCKEGDDR